MQRPNLFFYGWHQVFKLEFFKSDLAFIVEEVVSVMGVQTLVGCHAFLIKLNYPGWLFGLACGYSN